MGRIGVDSNVGFPGRDWGCGGGGGRHAVDGSGGEKRFVDLFHGEEEEEEEEEEERERKRDERDERAAGLKLGLTGRQRRERERKGKGSRSAQMIHVSFAASSSAVIMIRIKRVWTIYAKSSGHGPRQKGGVSTC